MPTNAILRGTVHEGAFRVLRSLHAGELGRSALIRACGEGHAVIADLEKRKPKWFDATGPTLSLSDKGQHAYARELEGRTPVLDDETLVTWLAEVSTQRPVVKRELDQVLATLRTVAKRARRLIETGETQRGVLFVGDDDLTSVALTHHLQAMGQERTIHAVDVDAELVEFLTTHGVDAKVHDVREPFEASRKFGCVFTDPPYAPAGFALFVDRATPLLKDDGRLWVCFGHSRRSGERGLQKQRILTAAGLLIAEVVPDFNTYDGAESIGARSSLWICARTPQTRAIEVDPEAALYTRREPD